MNSYQRGLTMFCGLLCLWPILFHLAAAWITNRVKRYGWRGLIPSIPERRKKIE